MPSQVPVVLRVLAERDASVSATLKKTTAEFNELGAKVKGVADMAALLSGGLAAGIGGIGLSALKVAGQFEQLQAKLTSVLGSSTAAAESFQRALEFAANTPFDVQSIVSATTQLTAFGQNAERTLPLATNLAAAFGERAEDVATVIGKAFSGSLEGFESLRNRFGIGNAVLARYGAELTKTGSVALGTSAQLGRVQTALERIILTRFGDATARQSATLFGALSNLGDAAQTLAANFGKTRVPATTFITKSLADVLGAVNAIPDGFKLLIAGTSVAAGAVAAFTAATAAALGGLLLMQGQLSSLALVSPVAASALSLVTGAIDAITGSAVAARGAFAFLAANPLVLAIGAVVAAAGAGALAMNGLEKAEREAGDAVTEASRKFAASSTSLRQGVALINAAQGATGKQVQLVGDSAKQIAQFESAFKSLSPEALASAMDKAGVSAEEFKKQLTETTGSIDKQKVLVAALEEEIKKLSTVNPGLDAKIGIDPARLARIEQLKEQLAGLRFELGQNQALKTFFEGVIGKVDELASKLKPLIEDTKAMNTFLDLSKSIGTTQALTNALADADQQILKNASSAQVGSANLDLLLQKLKALGDGPNTADQRQAIQEQITAIQKRAAIAKTLADQQKTEDDKANSARELAFRRQQALNDNDLQEQLTHVNARLKVVAEGTEEEVALLEQRNRVTKEIAQKQLQDQKEFIKLLEDAGQAIGAVGGDLGEGLAKDSSQAAKEKLEGLNQALADQMATATTNAQKLQAVEAAITALTKARKAGLVDEEASKKQMVTLDRERLQIQTAISQQAASEARETAGLKLQGLEQQLALEKALQSVQGETFLSRQKIADLENRILSDKIQAAREQGQAELRQGVSPEQVAARTEERITQIKNAEILKRVQAEQGLTKAVETEENKRKSLIEQLSKNRLGGPNSPLQSLAESAARGLNLGDFSFGSFGSGFAGGRFNRGPGLPPPPQTLSSIQGQVARDLQRGDVLAGRGQPNPYSSQINEVERQAIRSRGVESGATGGSHTEISQTININGQPSDGTPALKALAKQAVRELVKDAELHGELG